MTELMKRYEAEHKGIMPCRMEIPGGFIYSKEYVKWLEAQLTWRQVSESLPEKEKPVYPKPWRNRAYKPYIVTDGHVARFAFFAEVSKDRWWFVNPHNHHEIKDIVAWKDASLGLPIPPATEGE